MKAVVDQIVAETNEGLGLHWFDGQWAKGQNPKGSPHEDTGIEAGSQQGEIHRSI
jgi:hypothetical protein